MHKILYWFGVLAALLTTLILVGFSYLYYKGYGLDKESKIYAQVSLSAITSPWNSHALLDRASPKLLRSVNSEQIRSMFDRFGVLGPLIRSEECKGSAAFFISVGQPDNTTAQYVCDGQYREGLASVRLSLIKIDQKWMINGFNVNSPVLLEHKPIQNL